MEEMELETNGQEHLDIERRSNGTQIFNEPYSPENIERIKTMIENFYNTGVKKFYSIHVDGETVVQRNCDARKFNTYLPFVGTHTKKVEVKLYSGYSPKCNTYIFYLHRGLSGAPQNAVNVKEQISQALAEQELKFELKQLQEELKKKNKKIEKLQSVIEGHSSWTPEAVNNTIMNGLTAVGKIGMMRNGGLQGVPQQENQPQSEVHVELEEEEPDNSKSGAIFQEMLKQYGDKTMKNALGWTGVLAAYPELQDVLREEVERIEKEKEESDGDE
ncbi:MAG: hypothetical protein R2780_01775 [Crocinitomicaceae bacterium]